MPRSSAASSCHAAAAACSGPEPDPEYINAELTSGGNAAKSNMAYFS
ncbi:putative lipoprotein [Mycobacterium xenopi 4042]|uniref:Putative lipoprotein n=1 Tax=Mycobacterium xenopi 4042 TaxID=1299334 RepID=X7ZTZ4_MYCXE|nr:putative lipoprotein [Mycobacterium xenopi 4042]EUA24344.1 putative lipoprotein [Mycobacterium xenopi 3993]